MKKKKELCSIGDFQQGLASLELLYRYKRAKAAWRITVLNILKLYIYFVLEPVGPFEKIMRAQHLENHLFL